MREALYPANSLARKLARLGQPISEELREQMAIENRLRRKATPTRQARCAATLGEIIDAINATETIHQAAARLSLSRTSVKTIHRILKENRLRVVRYQKVEFDV